MKPQDNNPADPFKKALAEATKTMADDPDMTVSYSVDPPGMNAEGVRLPQVSRRMTRDEVMLARGTADEAYLQTLAVALQRIKAFGADVVVVALGLDAFIGDPFKGLAITEAGFGRIAAAIAALGVPCLFVQEGGYLCPELGQNLQAVLAAWT